MAPGPLELLIIGLICLAVVAGPVVLLIIILLTRAGSSESAAPEGRVRCPECAEWIMAEAVKCRFCGAELQKGPEPPTQN